MRLHPDHPSPLSGDLPARRSALAKAWARWGRARGKERAAAMLKARTGFDSRLLTWSRIWMGCSKSDLSGCRGPLPSLPLLTKEGSEKPQKLPTRFGEEPFKISASIYFGFGRVEIFRFCFMRGELEQKPKARALILTIGHL